MRFIRLNKHIFPLVLVALLLVAGVWAQQVMAGRENAPVMQASPLHPTFALLDEAGLNVLESGSPISTMQTCGQCHNTEFIATHSYHTDLGYSQPYTPGSAPSGRAWDTSDGLYGKWDPLTYRYLSPSGDSRTDLDLPAWVAFYASRLAGGGPAEAVGLEMNCFLCHLEQPDNAARIAAIQSGQIEWAGTASLLSTGIVEQDGQAYTWNPSAFNADGTLAKEFISIQDPGNENCAQCHGLVQTGPSQPLVVVSCSLDNRQTATTGQVVSDQKISLSGMNLAGKAELSRPWDIHAARGLECTDCHYSVNNPIYSQGTASSRPAHLQYDPRRLEIGEYLERPNHNFALGSTRPLPGDASSTETMRSCETCHDESIHSEWLPYADRHLQELACQTCHIPQLYAPAVQAYDWTVLQADGEPVSVCRGVDGDSGTLADLVTGYEPVLLERVDDDGKTRLAPYNLVTTWYWVYEDPQGLRPVRMEDLRQAWFDGDQYASPILPVFDGDGDGVLSSAELRLDTREKEGLIASRLESLGLANPHITGEVQPYAVQHGVAGGDWATRECQACHSDESRLAGALTLSGYLPGGVLPVFTGGTNTLASSELSVQDGALVYQPKPEDQGRYIFGHNRVGWIDLFGVLFFAGVLVGVSGHGGLRAYHALRQARLNHGSKQAHPELKRVYMYSVYERFWHWLQTFTIVILLFTGLIIHRPDLFGWLSFRHMVLVHNVLAIILVINAGLSLFYHLVSGEIRQFIPRPYGFFDQAIVQAKFYLQGIFRGDAHPFEKTPKKKLNPLQQVTYFGILNVLLPLQVLTGLLMFGVQLLPDLAQRMGGLPFLAPFHSLVAWTFAAFIVGHVYLTTTGHAPLAGIEAMMNGWEDVESAPEEAPAPGQSNASGGQLDAAAAD